MPWTIVRYVVGALLLVYSFLSLVVILYRVLCLKVKVKRRLNKVGTKDVWLGHFIIVILLLGLSLSLLDFFGLVPLF